MRNIKLNFGTGLLQFIEFLQARAKEKDSKEQVSKYEELLK